MKIRAKLIGQKNDKVGFLIHPDDRLFFEHGPGRYGPKKLLTLDIAEWKPAKTQKQLGLFFVCLDYYCEQAGYYTESEKYWLRKGIEQTYSLKKGTGVLVDGIEQRVGIPLSECNRWDQFEAFYNGIFHMAENHVPVIDMSEFVNQYKQLKEEQMKSRAVVK